MEERRELHREPFNPLGNGECEYGLKALALGRWIGGETAVGELERPKGILLGLAIGDALGTRASPREVLGIRRATMYYS